MANLEKVMKQYNLLSWYKDSFSKQEQKVMQDKYKYADDVGGYYSDFDYLSILSTWFNTKENYIICKKITEKSLELLPETKANPDIIRLHFFYQNCIQFYYKNRDKDNNLEIAIDFCNKQIDIAPDVANEFRKDDFYKDFLPRHVGYQQLAIIYKKNKQWNEVIELCKKGISEGWNNDFEARIEEAQKHLS